MSSYYNVVCYRAAHHASYEDALKCDAVHTTPSTIDAVSGSGGFFDTEEVVTTVLEMVGDAEDYAVGVVNDLGLFVPFSTIYRGITDNEELDPLDVINAYIGEPKPKLVFVYDTSSETITAGMNGAVVLRHYNGRWQLSTDWRVPLDMLVHVHQALRHYAIRHGTGLELMAHITPFECDVPEYD